MRRAGNAGFASTQALVTPNDTIAFEHVGRFVLPGSGATHVRFPVRDHQFSNTCPGFTVIAPGWYPPESEVLAGEL